MSNSVEPDFVSSNKLGTSFESDRCLRVVLQIRSLFLFDLVEHETRYVWPMWESQSWVFEVLSDHAKVDFVSQTNLALPIPLRLRKSLQTLGSLPHFRPLRAGSSTMVIPVWCRKLFVFIGIILSWHLNRDGWMRCEGFDQYTGNWLLVATLIFWNISQDSLRPCLVYRCVLHFVFETFAAPKWSAINFWNFSSSRLLTSRSASMYILL